MLPKKRLTFFILAFVVFSFLQFVGGDFFDLSKNYQCFKYLGCNAGFFGYDAVVHFFAGILFASALLWVMEAHPRFHVLPDGFWKKAFVTVAICVFVSVSWEVWEFTYDHVRVDIFHENLVQENMLLQPTNADTMGDLTFGFGGSVTGVILAGALGLL